MLLRSSIFVLLQCASELAAQKPVATVQAGVPAHSRNTEIPYPLSEPRADDSLDILVSNPNVRISLVLPSGAGIDAENIDSERFGWEQMDSKLVTQSGRRFPAVLAGSGTHVFITFHTDYPAGLYKIRADARQASTDSILKVKRISSQQFRIAALQMIPGVRMKLFFSLLPGRKASSIKLVLPRSKPNDYLDIVITGPAVKFRLVLPDGRSIDESNAKGLGLVWQVVDYHEIADDPMAAAAFLPIEGTHTIVAFGSLDRPAGSYTIEVDTSAANQECRLSVLFAPANSLFKELFHLNNPPGLR